MISMVLPKSQAFILELFYNFCILNSSTDDDPARKAQAGSKGRWPGKFQSTSSFHQNGKHIAQAHCEHGYIHLELAYRPHQGIKVFNMKHFKIARQISQLRCWVAAVRL